MVSESLVDEELHAVEFLQQVVRKFDVRLVDLVDQQHHTLFRVERFPELALLDVVSDVLHTLVTELGIAQARDRIVFVETVESLGGAI